MRLKEKDKIPKSISALLYKFIHKRATKIAFVENQLSPSSIGISPLFTNHPRVLQQSRVRSSTTFYCRFKLFINRSLGFGSYIILLSVAFFYSFSLRLPFPGSASSQNYITRKSIIQKVRLYPYWAQTARRFKNSGSISLCSLAILFQLSLALLVHYRCLQYLALEVDTPFF
jgi:hypothetical protein